MRFLAQIVALLLASTATFAQEPNKCKVGGAWVYQDSPCKVLAPVPASQKTAPQGVVAIPPSAPPAISPSHIAAEQERQKIYLAKAGKDRRIADLKFEIDQSENSIFQLQRNRQVALDRLEAQKSTANNNLAGAIYLNSLATEKQSVNTRYDSDINTQRERVKTLRDDLVKAQKE